MFRGGLCFGVIRSMRSLSYKTHSPGFFGAGLGSVDSEIAHLIGQETHRLQSQIELIASENVVSKAVLEAQGSTLTNKYAEGYPGRRYYGGCEYVDEVETLAINRLKKLFNCNYANVQPNSGSQANQCVFLALLKPGDTFMGLSLAEGGHLTHGSPVNLSGKWFNAVSYGVDPVTHRIDYDKVHELAQLHKPKLICAGASAYSRVMDFKKFREISDSVGAYFWVDMAHYAGLVAAGVYPDPLPHAHVVSSTTHKTLRGPRGGIILSNDVELGKKFNSAIFPGLQGGPLMHVIAAKAVAFHEALQPEFKVYMQQVVKNAQTLTQEIIASGLSVVSGGTDSHLLLVDLRPKKVTGKAAEKALERAGITCNKNSVPNDPEKPMVTSGIRLGTPASTTRGFGQAEFQQVGRLIGEVIEGLRVNGEAGNSHVEAKVRQEVTALCAKFPVY